MKEKLTIFLFIISLCFISAGAFMGVYASKSITYNISGEFSYTVPELYNSNGSETSNLIKYIADQLKSNESKFNSIKFTGTKPEVVDGTQTIDVGYNSSTKKFNDSYVAYCTLNSNSMYDIVVYSKIGNKFVLTQKSAYMFSNCKNLTELDLRSFDTSNVTNMGGMFSGCSKLTSLDLGENFNTSNVTNMGSMFYWCESFNSDISNWDVSNVTNMEGMFEGCRLFNQDISIWDVSKVENMIYMFYGCPSFNQDISRWNVSNVKNMYGMFCNCKNFNQDLSRWNVSEVKSMSYMFYRCESFNQDISSWNVSNVTNMRNMFVNCESFNQDISKWDVSNVRDNEDMFYYCSIEEKYKPKFK